jgi:metallo-beta-lactamase family protein
MLSAHADAKELLRWLSGFRRAPARTFIVHGEPTALEGLRIRVDTDLGWISDIPRREQVFEL